MKTIIRYKIYAITHGLLIEPMEFGTRIYSDYETMEAAVSAMEEQGGCGLAILPSVFTVLDQGES